PLLLHDASPPDIYSLSLQRRSSDLSRVIASRGGSRFFGCASASSRTNNPSISTLGDAVMPRASPDRSRGDKLAEHVPRPVGALRSEEHTSELQSRENLVCRLLLEKK